MKKNIFMLAIIAFGFISCSTRHKENKVQSYNEKVLSTLAIISEKLATERGNLLAQNFTKEENLKIVEELSNTLDTCITMMNTLNAPEETTNVRKSITKYYVFQKDSILPLFRESIDIDRENEKWYLIWNKIAEKQRIASLIKEEIETHQIESLTLSNKK